MTNPNTSVNGAMSIKPIKTPRVWYFTFMQKQRGIAYRYVRLEGSMQETHDMMMLYCGGQFAFQYNENEFLPQIDRFGLRKISLEEASKYIRDHE